MTGKVFIFLGIILTLFHVLLFYKKYLEIPASVLNKNLQIVLSRRGEK